MNQQDLLVIIKLRELYVELGAKLEYPLGAVLGLNPAVKSKSGTFELTFDYGAPVTLRTTEGCYHPFGSSVGDNPTADPFLNLLQDYFEIGLISPQRDDSQTDAFTRQTQLSGPRVALGPKGSWYKPGYTDDGEVDYSVIESEKK